MIEAHIPLALDVSEDSVSYAVHLLPTAGLVRTARKAGRCSTGSLTAYPPRYVITVCAKLVALTHADDTEG